MKAKNDFVGDAKLAQDVSYFAKLSEAPEPARRELAYAVLTGIANNNLAAKPARESALVAARKIHADGQPVGTPSNKVTIESIGYEQALAGAQREKGDPALGAQLFQKLGCVNCHTVSKSEPLKGPFLGDITTRYNRAELTESILKPSAKIAQGFEPQWFETKDGEVHDGFIVRESGTEIEIRNAAGVAQVLAIKDITKRGKRELSIMPEGLASGLSVQEFASILAYLTSLNAK